MLELRGYIDGAVAEVHPDQGVTVESTCSLVQGIFGIGGETSGELIMGVKAPDQPLLPEQLNPSMKGKVVVGGAFLSAATMARAKELGIVGLVVGASMTRICARCSDMTWALRSPAPSRSASRSSRRKGSVPFQWRPRRLHCSPPMRDKGVNIGVHADPGGVIRPEIIIPHSGPAAATKLAQIEREGIQLGDPVRIIRDPLFGKIGAVSGLPSELRAIPTESEVRVLEVRFPDGTTTVVPRANIEVIEGA